MYTGMHEQTKKTNIVLLLHYLCILFYFLIVSNMEESPFGPLTQRLVSALIEENIMTPMDDTMNEITGGKGIMHIMKLKL